jgi:immune inhibitor A
MSTGDLNAKLAKYDVWDRYDSDGDGNFNEPDG